MARWFKKFARAAKKYTKGIGSAFTNILSGNIVGGLLDLSLIVFTGGAYAFFLGNGDVILSRDDYRYKNRVRDTRNKYYELWRVIRNKYELDISDSILYDKASEYAKKEADSHFKMLSSLFNPRNLFNTLLSIVGTVVGIVLAPFTGGASGYIVALSLASLGASMLNTIISDNAFLKANFNSGIINSTSIGVQSKSEAYKARNAQITNLLIYNPYAMLPEGSLYKDENAGLVTYRAGLEAPNPMKAINGEKNTNPFAEQITNTAHKHLAGNAEYNPLNLPFPQAEFTLSQKLSRETQSAGIRHYTTQINNGFSELASNYFCAFDSVLFNKLFKKHLEERVDVRIKRLNSYEFLRANKYYQKGERLPTYFVRHTLSTEVKIKDELQKYRNGTDMVLIEDIEYDYKAQANKHIQESFVEYECYKPVYDGDSNITGSMAFRTKNKPYYVSDEYGIGSWWVRSAQYGGGYNEDGSEPSVYIKGYKEIVTNTQYKMMTSVGLTGETYFASYIFDDDSLAIFSGDKEGDPKLFGILPQVTGNIAIFVRKVDSNMPEHLKAFESLEDPYHEMIDNDELLDEFFSYNDIRLLASAKHADLVKTAKEQCKKHNIDYEKVFFYYELASLVDVSSGENDIKVGTNSGYSEDEKASLRRKTTMFSMFAQQMFNIVDKDIEI